MSSINTINFFPTGGPNITFVRFSTAASNVLWTSIDVVRDEKFIGNTIYRDDKKREWVLWENWVFLCDDDDDIHSLHNEGEKI